MDSCICCTFLSTLECAWSQRPPDAWLIVVGSDIFSGLPTSLSSQETKEPGSFSGNLWGLRGVWGLTCWLSLRLQQDSPSGSWDSLHHWGSCQVILAAKLSHPTSGESSCRNDWYCSHLGLDLYQGLSFWRTWGQMINPRTSSMLGNCTL